MALPSTHELEGAIADILSNARDDNRLGDLTVRIVRQQLATHFDLEEDVLTTKYKSFIKTTVHTTVERFQNASDEGTGVSRGGTVTKEKSGSRKGKVQVRASDEEGPQAEADGSAPEGAAPPPKQKKTPARSKTSKAKSSREPREDDEAAQKSVKSSKTSSKKPESDMKFKSKATIESSDEEAAPQSGKRKPAGSPKKQQKASPPKQIQKVIEDHSDIEMKSVGGPGPSGSGSKPMPAIDLPRPSVSKAKEQTGDPTESELSSVIDEPPKKRQKKQEKDAAKPEEEKTKRGKKKEALSKDEETVNRLKSIVVACGVRKVWKKEFEGLDRPSQQIKRLHSILGELGMTPRYSLEKAKAIRDERELAQELKDVQEFEKTTKGRGKAPQRSSSETEESANEGGSDADVPAQKKQNARASIMAFLQDQSEEE